MKNKSLIEKVCELLNVEVGETWKDNNGYLYTINDDGSITTSTKDGKLVREGYIYWEDIFTERITPIKMLEPTPALYLHNSNWYAKREI